MEYKVFGSSTLPSSYEKNVLVDKVINHNFGLKSVHVTISSAVVDNAYTEDREKFLFKALINQRKVYRYYKSATEYEQGLMSEIEFENYEQNCILTLANDDEKKISAKLTYFYNLMKKYAPEEIEFMNNEDLAELVSVSEHKINKIHYKMEDEQ